MQFGAAIRMERPIQNCELTPYAYLNVKGAADNITRAKLLESNPHYFVYRWYRGTSKVLLCANQSCVRSSSYDTAQWTKFVLSENCVRCGVCDRAGLRKENSSFCSIKYVTNT